MSPGNHKESCCLPSLPPPPEPCRLCGSEVENEREITREEGERGGRGEERRGNGNGEDHWEESYQEAVGIR